MGRRRLYTYRYTVTTRMIPALRWVSDESHFNVSVGSDGQSHKTVSTNHNLFEEKGEAKRYRTEVSLLPCNNFCWPRLPLLIYSRSTRLTGSFYFPQTAVYRACHLSTLIRRANVFFLHFSNILEHTSKKKLESFSLSQPLPFNQHLKLAFSQHDIGVGVRATFVVL